jgi:hypothetical protein
MFDFLIDIIPREELRRMQNQLQVNLPLPGDYNMGNCTGESGEARDDIQTPNRARLSGKWKFNTRNGD